MALIGAFGLMGVFGATRGFLPALVARGLFYGGLIAMILVALWDLIRPAPRCAASRAQSSARNA